MRDQQIEELFALLDELQLRWGENIEQSKEL